MEGLSGNPESMPQFWGVLGYTAGGGYWKYVEVDTGEKELYNEATDPHEMTNLYGNPTFAAQQTELKGKLVRLKGAALAGTGATADRAAPKLRTDLPTGPIVGPDLD
jgi:hypothetical protein